VRAPTPPPEELPAPADEKSLNAAAAREVSRELDALMFHSPTESAGRAPPSPLAPPAAPFAAGRSVSPRPPANTDALRVSKRASDVPSAPDAGRSSQDDPQSGSPTSPRSPTQRGLPPPPNISLPRPSFPSNNASSSTLGGNTPFSTPPEFPRNPSATSLPLPKTVPPPPASSGNGKISAAAFRQRQQANRNASQGSIGGGAGPADTTPLAFKKRPLPSSPYPQRGAAPGQGQNQAQSPSLSQLQQEDAGALPYPRRPGADAAEQRPLSTASSEFDYISAYMSDGPADPAQGDFERRSGEGRDVNGGYGQGRYATNVGDGGLR
jgi:hypothetical protein